MPDIADTVRQAFDSVPAAFATTDGFALVREDEYYPFGDVRLTAGERPLALWSGDAAPRLHPHLRVFLEGGDGYHYALWRVDDRPWSACPVVYLDDENTDNSVVASSVDEFLSLAAVGTPRVTATTDWSQGGEREAFFSVRGIVPPLDPGGVVGRAIAGLPDFHRWLQGMLSGAPHPEALPAVTLPTDPTTVVGAPVVGAFVAEAGVEIGIEEGLVQTIWLTPEASRFRPRGLALFGRTRPEARALLGRPARARDQGVDTYDRFDDPTVALHVTYGDGTVTRICLMWFPGLPASLRKVDP